MENLLKWGLIAVGGYVGYKYLAGPSASLNPLPSVFPVNVSTVSQGPDGISNQTPVSTLELPPREFVAAGSVPRIPPNFRRVNLQLTPTTIRPLGPSTLSRLGAAIPAARVMPRSSRYLTLRGR